MKQITINIPDNYELKQEGNTYTVVEKDKKLTYEDIVEKLFKYNSYYYITGNGGINRIDYSHSGHISINDFNNCTSKKQAEKLLAINKLMNIAKYLNGDWQPDWENVDEIKHTIAYDYKNNRLISDITCMTYDWSFIYFKSKELAKKAIEILGEDVIKLALCTDY